MGAALGVAAMFSNHSLKRDFCVLGMAPINGPHTAENVKTMVEKIVNDYRFNKTKIVSVATDEGKNMCRLFNQNSLPIIGNN
jgi:hypothetical protein